MAFRWRADNDPSLNVDLVALSFSGIRTSIAKKPYDFVIFQGGGSRPIVPPLDPPMFASSLVLICYVIGAVLIGL